eukprot:15474742-Alexandrium_andersonii.AAC.1
MARAIVADAMEATPPAAVATAPAAAAATTATAAATRPAPLLIAMTTRMWITGRPSQQHTMPQRRQHRASSQTRCGRW